MNSTWVVIGAGPAGIAAVGKLIDQGVLPKNIAWIDPAFRVGDLGQKWFLVSSNTKVELFIQFLRASPAFQFSDCPIDFDIHHLAPDDTCVLQKVVEPLQWITGRLMESVRALKSIVIELVQDKSHWQVVTARETITAKNVILAIGADPKTLPDMHQSIISVEYAMDINKLKHACTKNDIVGVIGCSHTAVIALYNLIEVGVSKVFNFYRSPLKYAIHYDDWILYDNTGLKGYSAKWARTYLETQQLDNLQRVSITDEKYPHMLNSCTKVIQAVGFTKRTLKISAPYNHLHYDESTGRIAPGLYGIGIAFPEGKFDRVGNYEYQVGLWKFMRYLSEKMPSWIPL